MKGKIKKMKEKLEKLLPFIVLTLFFGVFIVLLPIDLYNHVNYWNDIDTFDNCSHEIYYAHVQSRDDLSNGNYKYSYGLAIYTDEGIVEYATIESDTFSSVGEYCILEVVDYVKPKYGPIDTTYESYKTEYYIYDIGQSYYFDEYEFFR